MNMDAMCPSCGYKIDDGKGPGIINRHINSPAHLLALDREQRDTVRKLTVPGHIPWEPIEVTEELLEDEERIQLRRELERAQAAYDRDEQERANAAYRELTDAEERAEEATWD